jgi:hypothetical protein
MKICSVTLCGNSENDIGDAIKSIINHVDVICFINTGSTDQSSQIAREIAGDKFVEKHYQWINDFADARNSFFKFAQECECDYFVIVDSDERIVFDEKFSIYDLKNLLSLEKLDGYSFRYQSKGGNFSYLKEKILKSDISDQYRYSQKTHECFPMYALKTKVFSEGHFWELGKNKEKLIKKFQRDIEILTHELAEKPSDPRSTFYMARSHHDLWTQQDNPKLNQYHAIQALEWYQKRTQIQGYYDEKYISQLYSSRIKKNIGWNDGIGYSEIDVLDSFMKCTQYNSDRIEHFEHIIEYYQSQKDWENAYIFSSYAVKKIWKDFLFSEPQIYQWKIYDLHAMNCFYARHHNEMKKYGEILKQILENKNLIPLNHTERIKSNLKFYLPL